MDYPPSVRSSKLLPLTSLSVLSLAPSSLPSVPAAASAASAALELSDDWNEPECVAPHSKDWNIMCTPLTLSLIDRNEDDPSTRRNEKKIDENQKREKIAKF